MQRHWLHSAGASPDGEAISCPGRRMYGRRQRNATNGDARIGEKLQMIEPSSFSLLLWKSGITASGNLLPDV